MGINLTKQRSVTSFADLTDDGRLLAQNYIDDNQATMAKAWHIYGYVLDNIDAKRVR